MKTLFIIGLLILACGIGLLVYGMTETHLGEGGMIKPLEHYPGFIAAGAGLIVVGLGIFIGSIVWKRK